MSDIFQWEFIPVGRSNQLRTGLSTEAAHKDQQDSRDVFVSRHKLGE